MTFDWMNFQYISLTTWDLRVLKYSNQWYSSPIVFTIHHIIICFLSQMKPSVTRLRISLWRNCCGDLPWCSSWQSPDRGRPATQTCRWGPRCSLSASPRRRRRSRTWRWVASPGWWVPGTPSHTYWRWRAEARYRQISIQLSAKYHLALRVFCLKINIYQLKKNIFCTKL